jgi:hypothetical protein
MSLEDTHWQLSTILGWGYYDIDKGLTLSQKRAALS